MSNVHLEKRWPNEILVEFWFNFKDLKNERSAELSALDFLERERERERKKSLSDSCSGLPRVKILLL